MSCFKNEVLIETENMSDVVCLLFDSPDEYIRPKTYTNINIDLMMMMMRLFLYE